MTKDHVTGVHHVGWIVESRENFEKFWCDLLGFECCHTGYIDEEKADTLFGTKRPATVLRYQRAGFNVEIEIHVFEKLEEGAALCPPSDFILVSNQSPSSSVRRDRFPFDVIGINHICLHVVNRQEFMDSLPESITKRIYEDPRGWTNMFIQDFDGHWIELRE